MHNIKENVRIKVTMTSNDKDGSGRVIDNRSTVKEYYFNRSKDAVIFSKACKAERGFTHSKIERM